METPLIILSMLKEEDTSSISQLAASLSKSEGTIQPGLRNLRGQGLGLAVSVLLKAASGSYWNDRRLIDFRK
ncbi:MAG: ArsR family transcriptional regulator [Methylobacter sp.]